MKLRYSIAAVITAIALSASLACSQGDSRHEAGETRDAALPTAQALPDDFARVLAEVAAVRELPPPSGMKVGFVPRSQVVALLDALTTDEDRHSFATTTTLYRLLGHLGKEQDFLSVYRSFGAAAVAGLYSPLEDTLWVVSDESNPAFAKLPAQEKETLAHELVHAIQDGAFDSVAQYRSVADDLDASLSWTALVEGDAMTHQQRWAQKYLAVPVGTGAGRAMLLASPVSLQAVPAAIARELLFPYTTGAEWVGDVRSRLGAAGVTALFRALPRNTSYVLHPELLNSEWKAAAVSLPDLSKALGNGFTRESGGTFGEFSLRNWLQSRLKALDAANAAAGWDGDHYDVYVSGKESVAVFRLRFRDEAEARQFAEAQQAYLKATNAAPAGGDARVVATPDGIATATTGVRGVEVVFTLASSPDLAKRALDALSGS